MKKVILVVDDNKANLIHAQRLLAASYKVAAVNSGKQAFSYLEKNIPNLILLDIQMPEMDGFSVMETLQQDVRWKKIPVIFLTADRSEGTEENCFKMGAMDYITKPFIPSIMQQRVRRILELEDYQTNLEQMVEAQTARITQMQQDIIMTMANLIESRDGTTGEHIRRTSIYSNLLARHLLEKGIYANVIDEDFVECLSKVAPLHDIGKITIPDAILRKPGKLTAEEYEQITSHAREGARLLEQNMASIAEPEFLQMACDVACYHHEKWSGGGYPDGLKGEEIPLSARILAIADVFDALISKRSYKKSMTVEDAFAIMEKEREERFEPILFDAFLELKPELVQLIEEN